MIYIFAALYQEAKPMIQRLGLKKERAEFGYEIYAGEQAGVRLVITGVGMVAAAAAVGSVFTYYHAGKKNMDGITLINFGSCAGEDGTGKVYLCNKIIDRISGHTFYPDIVYRHDFPESYVVTEPGILKSGLRGQYWDGLHDMEASAIYQAGSRILGPHQMSFFKVITDSGRGEKLCIKNFEEIMETGTKDFLKYLLERREWDLSEKGRREKKDICGQDFEQLCLELHCSEAMKMAVRQCIKYWSLVGIDYQTVLRQMREQEELPCRDRREGKKRFEELKKRLL